MFDRYNDIITIGIEDVHVVASGAKKVLVKLLYSESTPLMIAEMIHQNIKLI